MVAVESKNRWTIRAKTNGSEIKAQRVCSFSNQAKERRKRESSAWKIVKIGLAPIWFSYFSSFHNGKKLDERVLFASVCSWTTTPTKISFDFHHPLLEQTCGAVHIHMHTHTPVHVQFFYRKYFTSYYSSSTYSIPKSAHITHTHRQYLLGHHLCGTQWRKRGLVCIFVRNKLNSSPFSWFAWYNPAQCAKCQGLYVCKPVCSAWHSVYTAVQFYRNLLLVSLLLLLLLPSLLLCPEYNFKLNMCGC